MPDSSAELQLAMLQDAVIDYLAAQARSKNETSLATIYEENRAYKALKALLPERGAR